MKRLICAPEVPASQMVLTIITDEQLEAFADAVITKYQQTIVRHKAAEKPLEEWMTRKEVMTLLRRCNSTMTKWARRGYLVPSMVGGKCLSMALFGGFFCFFVPCCYLCGERLTAIFVYDRRHITTSVLCR